MFNKFVSNVLRDNIGTVIFDLRGHGGCWRLKAPLGGQKWHEGVDLLKKVFRHYPRPLFLDLLTKSDVCSLQEKSRNLILKLSRHD